MNLKEMVQGLLIAKKAAEQRQNAIQEAINALQAIDNGETVSSTPPARINSGRARSTKSQPMGSTGNGEMSNADKKKAYMLQWRAERAKKLGLIPPKARKPKITAFNNTIKGTPANKFTLDREFSLEDMDVKLMHSYLMSWKGLGRLTLEESNTLNLFAGRAFNLLAIPERELMRSTFYGCRSRIISTTKRLANVN